jgi:hypothetical protein
MMKFNSRGTLHLKSGFHYAGTISSLTDEWLLFHDKKTNKKINVRVDSIDHFVPLEDDE